MALTMRMFRTRVEFEWDDQEVNSTVTISDQDDQDAVIRKLKRVIALVEGANAGRAAPAHVLPPRMGEIGHYGGIDAPAQTGSSWAAVYGPPPLPEHLVGEVELVPPEEGE